MLLKILRWLIWSKEERKPKTKTRAQLFDDALHNLTTCHRALSEQWDELPDDLKQILGNELEFAQKHVISTYRHDIVAATK
jgi:hypothetical protein